MYMSIGMVVPSTVIILFTLSELPRIQNFFWSRSCHIGYSNSLWCPSSSGEPYDVYRGAGDFFGVAACVYDIFNFQSGNSVQLE